MDSSTSLANQLGHAGAQEVRRTHNESVRSALSSNSGNEIKHTGDGIMASFSTASSALDAANTIQRGVAAHKEEQPESPLAVYVGLNAGEPIAEDDDLFGTSINLAARICDPCVKDAVAEPSGNATANTNASPTRSVSLRIRCYRPILPLDHVLRDLTIGCSVRGV